MMHSGAALLPPVPQIRGASSSDADGADLVVRMSWSSAHKERTPCPGSERGQQHGA